MTIEITVTVTDEDSNPLENVSVVFSQNDTSVDEDDTDINGIATIEVSEGEYTVTGTLENYITYTDTFTASANNNVLEIVLSPIFTGDIISDNSLFQANVFMENQGNVCGAEIIIYGQNSSEPIDKIVITDATDFYKFNQIIENLKEACVTYSSEDRTILDIVCDYLADKTNTEKEMKYLAVKDKWSTLSQKGDLKTILINNMLLTDEQIKSYEDNDMAIINATHLNGITAGDFSLVGHQHTNYVEQQHATIQGKADAIGHVKVADNLNTDEGVGTALSAKQGKELNKRVTNLENKSSGWSKPFTVDKTGYITLRVNESLHLVVCDYTRWDYTKLKSDTGIHDLHKAGTLGKYAPSQRVLTPVYRGDIVLMFNRDGSVQIHNLVKKDSWNIRTQVMWYYK